MLVNEILCLAMFATVCGSLLLGFPVAFTLAGTSLIFAGISLVFFGNDLASFLSAEPQRILAIAQNETLVAVPLFIFMGVMLERSKVAEELLDSMGKAFGPIRGGLAISVCVVGALLAASTGIVGATVVTMGLLSLPTMLRRGYSKQLATGTIAASGTLGQIIPPSIVLVLLGDQLTTAYQRAQLAMGNFSPDTVSVNDLFAGALFPGLVLVGMYIIYIVLVSIFRPKAAPAIPPEIEGTMSRRWGGAKAISGIMVAIVALMVVLILYNAFLAGPNGAIFSDTLIVFTALFLILMLFGYRTDPDQLLPTIVGFASYAGLLIMIYGVGAKIGGNFLIVYLILFAGILYGAFASAWADAFWGVVLRALIPPLVLIIAVLGSILGGLASPTEAAAVGAVGAIMLAGFRLDQKHGMPVLIGGASLIAILVLTAKFDLRMQRNVIATYEWIAIGAAFLLAIGLMWGIIVSVMRTATYEIQEDGSVARSQKLHRRRPAYMLVIVGLFAAMVAMAFGQLIILGLIVAAIIVYALVMQVRGRGDGSSKINTVLSDVVRQTTDITAMVFVILIGAAVFSLVFRGLGGDEIIEHFLKNLPGGALGAMLVVMLAMFILGFFLDFLEIVFIVVPIVAPILLQMEFNGAPMSPVWLGVMMAVNLQTSYLTPPFGFALFYLRGVAPVEVTTMDIYRGVIPFVIIQVLALVVLWYLPGLATWLPKVIFG